MKRIVEEKETGVKVCVCVCVVFVCFLQVNPTVVLILQYPTCHTITKIVIKRVSLAALHGS